jgi:hypothetical protein
MDRRTILGVLLFACAACRQLIADSSPFTVAAGRDDAGARARPAPAAPTVSISSVSPTTAIAGSENIVITIEGSGFQGPEIGKYTWSFVVMVGGG